MSITFSSPNNGKFFEVSGVYTGDVTKTFEVEIEDDDSFAWRSKAEDEEGWGDKTTGVTLTVGSELTLEDGIKIKFTRNSALTYTDGDTWTFTVLVDLKISSIEGEYDTLSTLALGDRNDLIAFSKSTGKITIIEKFDTEDPTIRPEVGNIGTSTTIDIERRNKELYIGTGKENSPKWVGYVDYSTFEGPIDSTFFTGKAMDVITSSESPNFDAFDISCSLRGGDGFDNTIGSTLIVGIKLGLQKLYVYNIPDSKLFTFNLSREPIMVKKYYAYNSGSPDYYCEGVAILCKPIDFGDAGQLQFWRIPSTGTNIGQNSNKEASHNLGKPEDLGDRSYDQGERRLYYFTDFVISPSRSDLSHSDLDTDANWTLIVAAKAYDNPYGEDDEVVTGAGIDTSVYSTVPWLWRNNDFKGLAQGADIDNWLNITPKIDFSNADWGYVPGASNGPGTITTEPKGAWYYLTINPRYGQEGAGQRIEAVLAGSSSYVIPKQYVTGHPEMHQLEFGGWDSGGQNPTVMWTCKLRPLENFGSWSVYAVVGQKTFDTNDWVGMSNENYWQNDLNNVPLFGPVISNDSSNISQRKFYGAKWVTYNIPVDTEGVVQQPILLHQLDWNDSNSNQEQWNGRTIGNVHSDYFAAEGGRDWIKGSVPSYQPLFGAKGRFHIWGDEDDDFSRMGMIYYRPGSYKVFNIKASKETSDSNSHWTNAEKPWLFPSAHNNTYTQWGTGTFPGRSGQKVPIDAGADDKMRWRLSEGSKGYKLKTDASVPNSNERMFIMGVKNGDADIIKFCKVAFNNTTFTTATNEWESEAGWLSFTSATESSAENWIGPTAKTLYYKIAFVYDGYQETPLMAKREVFYDGDVITGQISFQVKIDSAFVLSKRIQSMTVYRALSLDSNVAEPDTLYRFMEEIDLLQFNFDEGDDVWVADITDTGDTEGTYESINGISEKLHSMDVNYTCNTQQNGYHFVSNLKHTQILNAENYVFRSLPGKFSLFDWSTNIVQLSFTPTTLKGFMGKVYAFGQRNVSVINPETLGIEDDIEGIGCISPKHMMISDAGMFWVDYNNVYIAAPTMNTVGDNMIDIDTYGWNNLTMQQKDSVRLGYDAKRKAFLLFFTTVVGVTTYYRCWAYSMPNQRWDLWETGGHVMDTVATKDGSCIMLMKDGRICKYLSHPSNKRDWVWESKKLTLDNDMTDKKLRNIKSEASSRTNTTLKYMVDGSSIWESGTDISTNFTGATNRAVKIDLADNKNHWIRIQATANNTQSGSNVRLHALSVVYKPKRPK